MGHTRLGFLPKTLKWSQIVAAAVGREITSISDVSGDSVRHVSSLTLDAAKAGLNRANGDAGLQFTFYLLARLALASRTADWESALGALGISLANDATLFDLTAEFQRVIDDWLADGAHPTDISEIAQRAAGEAITSALRGSSMTLFGSSRDQLQQAVRERMSTKKAFGIVGQAFFGSFLARVLNFYLSRVTASQVGGSWLQQLGDLERFNDMLHLHCMQSARIVRDFSAEWYSKTEFKEGIDLSNTSRFLAVALRKLQAELAQQELHV